MPNCLTRIGLPLIAGPLPGFKWHVRLFQQPHKGECVGTPGGTLLDKSTLMSFTGIALNPSGLIRLNSSND